MHVRPACLSEQILLSAMYFMSLHMPCLVQAMAPLAFHCTGVFFHEAGLIATAKHCLTAMREDIQVSSLLASVLSMWAGRLYIFLTLVGVGRCMTESPCLHRPLEFQRVS